MAAKLFIGSTFPKKIFLGTTAVKSVWLGSVRVWPILPTVSTSGISSVTAYDATCGGNITEDGSSAITARGVCWSTSTNPTIANSHTSDGTGKGTFVSYLTGLDPDTYYYVRAYATNSVGTSYGDNVAFWTEVEETTYYSAAVDKYFIANDGHCDNYQCPPGEIAAAVYHMIAGYGAYTSTISQADADQQAEDVGQAAANAAPCACYYGEPQ